MRPLIVAILFSLVSPMATAGHHGKTGHGGAMKEPTKEERTQMATMHTQMAECLGTDKPAADCHKEMMNSCPMAKDGQCPMMEMGHHHKGKSGKSKDK